MQGFAGFLTAYALDSVHQNKSVLPQQLISTLTAI